MKLEELLDIEALMNHIDAGYVSVRHHSKGDLRIYNYTHKCQYDWVWTRTTITCRGLIVNTANEVVARPWQKFFTVEQYKDMRNDVHHLFGVKYKEMYEGPGQVTEKMDGCMGILYWVDGRPAIATRGSFTSHQAELATEIFRKKYEQKWCEHVGPDRNRTYIFECILPEYRIVVDYHGAWMYP
jgi:RNA ligase